MQKHGTKGILLLELMLSFALGTFFIAELFSLIHDESGVVYSLPKLIQSSFDFEKKYISLISNESSSTENVLPIDEYSKTFFEDDERGLLVNIDHALGSSSCNPFISYVFGSTTHANIYHSTISFAARNIPTALYTRNGYAYITTDSSTSSDPDFYIVSLSATSSEVISSLQTGPGLLSVVVAGNYAYVGNSSVNSQLQVIDISNPYSPTLVSSYKLPGNYNDATTVGFHLFFDSHKIYLATKKSQIEELHVIDVSDPYHPIKIAAAEIGAQINNIDVVEGHIYIATPLNEELQEYTLHGNVLLKVRGYDAPKGSGNGQVSLVRGSRVVLGRSLGDKELYFLQSSSSNAFDVLYATSVAASIDQLFLRGDLLVAVTSDSGSHLRFYHVSNDSKLVTLSQSFSLPTTARSVGFDCDNEYFLTLTSEPTPLYIISSI